MARRRRHRHPVPRAVRRLAARARRRLALALAPDVASAAAILVVAGYAGIGVLSGGNAVLQLAASAEMRGRVLALYTVVFLGSTPIGGPDRRLDGRALRHRRRHPPGRGRRRSPPGWRCWPSCAGGCGVVAGPTVLPEPTLVQAV